MAGPGFLEEDAAALIPENRMGFGAGGYALSWAAVSPRGSDGQVPPAMAHLYLTVLPKGLFMAREQ